MRYFIHGELQGDPLYLMALKLPLATEEEEAYLFRSKSYAELALKCVNTMYAGYDWQIVEK